MNLLYHPTQIQEGFRTTVHVGNVRQTAVIHSIQPLQQISMNNDKANVVFKFIRYPEYIKPGMFLYLLGSFLFTLYAPFILISITTKFN